MNRDDFDDDHDYAGSFLEARGIHASTVNYDDQFDSRERAAKIVQGFLSSQLGCEDIDGTLLEGLVKVFDKEHADETQFNIELFKEMAKCFDASSKWSVEHFPPTKDWSEDNPPRLILITGRSMTDDGAAPKAPTKQPAKEEPPAADDEEEPYPFARFDGIRATRSSSRVIKRKAAAAHVEGITGIKGNGEDFGPFVASAPPVHHHAADASTNADNTEKGELSQRRRRERQQYEEGWQQYALALVREAYVPEKQEGIVNRNSYLDHAIVIASRDANEKNRAGGKELGGWGVCQVLATVELKLIDSTCKELARVSDRDARIVIKRSNLTKTGGGAGPLAQEVMYVFGHVLWSHAALGLQLPTSLPLAVVAAMKEKAATAHPSTRMRWVYGNLDIPEECGGMFSFNVSSCGAFHGTAPESAIAVYMKVLMDGLGQGERWINDMLHPPPASGETGPTPKKPSPAQLSPPDARPWPSSMCGRRLCFGGSPLTLLDAKLVATPARMRQLDVPVSQGELYKGRVNLSELRTLSKEGKLRDVVWVQEVPDWSQVEATGLTQSLPSGVDVLQSGSGELDSNMDQMESLTSEACAQRSKEADARAKDMVMVKVTSKPCHRMLLLPDHAFLWSLQGFAREPARRVLALISGSLHALYLTGGIRFQLGLVQIMPDLQDTGYRPLRPNELFDKGCQKLMCKAFVRLIKQTLVPMALLNVVHADIRSRYHETANILCHKDNFTMRLIDLDSLMEFRYLEKIPEDQRIISHKNGKFSKWISCALEFVCLQAICVVSAWRVGKDMVLMSPEARSEAKKELDTEYVIKTYLVDKVWGGTAPTFAGDHRRNLYFAKPDCDACTFVLSEVRPYLEQFLGEPPDALSAMLELDY